MAGPQREEARVVKADGRKLGGEGEMLAVKSAAGEDEQEK